MTGFIIKSSDSRQRHVSLSSQVKCLKVKKRASESTFTCRAGPRPASPNGPGR